jgi:hypothetical protein
MNSEAQNLQHRQIPLANLLTQDAYWLAKFHMNSGAQDLQDIHCKELTHFPGRGPANPR